MCVIMTLEDTTHMMKKCASGRKRPKWIEVLSEYRCTKTSLQLDIEDESGCSDSDNEDLDEDWSGSYYEEFDHYDLNYYPSDRPKKLHKRRTVHKAIKNYKLKGITPKNIKLSPPHMKKAHSKNDIDSSRPYKDTASPKSSTNTTRSPDRLESSEDTIALHTLDEENAPLDLDDVMLAFFIELQGREIEPEDFETLSKLDELNRFPAITETSRSSGSISPSRRKSPRQLEAFQDEDSDTLHNDQMEPSQETMVPHTLHEDNDPLQFDEVMLAFLIELQDRDIEPEDYDELSKLDELLMKKTVQTDMLNGLPTVAMSSEMLELSADCMICMDAFIQGAMVELLPCDHFFHVTCIDRWLGESSKQCPLDNIPIESCYP